MNGWCGSVWQWNGRSAGDDSLGSCAHRPAFPLQRHQSVESGRNLCKQYFASRVWPASIRVREAFAPRVKFDAEAAQNAADPLGADHGVLYQPEFLGSDVFPHPIGVLAKSFKPAGHRCEQVVQVGFKLIKICTYAGIVTNFSVVLQSVNILRNIDQLWRQIVDVILIVGER